MSKRINLGKPSRELLIDLLNFSNGTDFPGSLLEFGTPRTLIAPEQAEHGRNTVMRVVPAEGSGYDNEVDLYYDRIDLARLFKSALVVGVDTQFSNSLEALTLVNLKYGLAISPAEIVNINAVNDQVAIEISQSDVYLPGTRIIVGLDTNESAVVDFEEYIDSLWDFTNFSFPTIANTPLDVA